MITPVEDNYVQLVTSCLVEDMIKPLYLSLSSMIEGFQSPPVAGL